MVFSSIPFLFYFLPITFAIYFAVPKKFKNLIIFISGLVFYAWGEPIYILAMLFSTVLDYTMGRLLEKFDEDEKKRLYVLLCSVIVNLTLLGVFKYSSFIVQNLNDLLNLNITDPKLPLPIGISFYTFQSMSYTIDLYKRNIKVQKSLLNFTSYVTLFPQMVAGPIVRYEEVANELEDRTINYQKISDGITLFIKGLGKKVLLGNNIGLLWSQIKVMDYGNMSSLTAWVGILAFTFQIYYDFSGYSDMACGLGKMLGFNFPQNFNYPYMSKSISEFWRRWHITLGSWFRSYVYIPMGGNRKGLPRTLFNLLVLWFLTGLWHGASWNFIVWGLYFGVLIVIEKVGFLKVLQKLPSFISTIYTFFMVVLGWVFFEVENLHEVVRYLRAMFGGAGELIDNTGKYYLQSNIFIFVICIIGSTELIKRAHIKLSKKNGTIVHLSIPIVQTCVFILCIAYLVNSTYNPFLYFRF